MNNQQDNRSDWERWGVKPPSHEAHGFTPDQIEEKLIKAEFNSWRLEGNELIAETNFGPLRQTIPTDVILMGTNDKGLPIFKRLEL